MTDAQGQTAVTTAALICSGLYVYRKSTETFTRTPKATGFKAGLGTYATAALGIGELEPTGPWLTGMGLTFIALSIATSVNASFGGSFAILVAVGSILGNGTSALKDLKGGLKQAPQPAQPAQKAG